MRAKVNMNQIKAEINDFDIDKVKTFFKDRNIIIPEEIKTKEELDIYIKSLYKI